LNWKQPSHRAPEFKRDSIKSIAIAAIISTIVAGCAACETHSQGNAASSNPTSAAGQLSAFRFIKGHALVYHIKYTSKSVTNLAGLFGARNSLISENDAGSIGASSNSYETNIDGTFTATVLEDKPEGALVAYRLTSADLRVTGDGAVLVWADAIKADLAKEMFGLVSPQGRVLSVRFDKDVIYASQTFGRTLLGITQFVLPNAPGSDLRQWDSQEDDPAGQYTAHYLTTTDSASGPMRAFKGSAVFKKVKTQYVEPIESRKSNRVQGSRILEPGEGFSAEFDFGAGRLKSFEGTEVQDVVQAGKLIGHAENTVRVEFIREDTPGRAEMSSLAQKYTELESTDAVPLSATPPEEMQQRAIQINTLGDSTLQSLLPELRAVEESQGQPNTTELYLRLKALIYLHPETSEVFGRILTTTTANSTTMNLVAEALGSAGSPLAQQALVTAIKARPDDEAAFAKLSFILAQTKTPTQQAENALSDVAFRGPETDIVKTAQLMLGAMARNIDQSDPDRAAKVVDRLIAQLGSSSAPNVQRRLLSALGNSGSTQAIPVIKQFTNDASPDLRGGAAYALRWVDSDEADDLLSTIIDTDSDPSVRLQALSALRYRDVNQKTFDAEERVFLLGMVESLRLAVLKNLWAARETFPKVVDIAKRAAGSDVSKEVRKAASDLIAGYK
jgi:hypothetical protein